MAAESRAVCLEWSTTRALAAGASEDEIAGVLLAVAPVAGLGRIAAAVRPAGYPRPAQRRPDRRMCERPARRRGMSCVGWRIR